MTKRLLLAARRGVAARPARPAPKIIYSAKHFLCSPHPITIRAQKRVRALLGVHVIIGPATARESWILRRSRESNPVEDGLRHRARGGDGSASTLGRAG